jgi:hypothetical protein
MTTTQEKTSQILDKLKKSRRPYVITASQASYRYHRWLSPAPKVIALRIYPDDYEWWRNTLLDETIYVSDAPPTSEMVESHAAAVLLLKSLEPLIYQNRRTYADLHYESPEDLCIEFLTGLITETSIMETLAILLIQRRIFQWDYFCKRVIALGLAREAGILLEIINNHTQQNLMPQAVIDLLFRETTHNDELKQRYYPFTWRVRLSIKRGEEKEIKITYPQVSQKWGIKVVLPLYIMEKLVLDLDYAWRTPSSAIDYFANSQAIPQFAD